MDRIKHLPAMLIEWLRSSPDEIPVDLREFKESQKRLYAQSAELDVTTGEFGKMVRRMASAKNGAKKKKGE